VHALQASASGEPVRMARSLAFVQILNRAKVADGGAKVDQWVNLENSIRSMLPFRSIGEYRLFWGTDDSFSQSPRARHRSLPEV